MEGCEVYIIENLMPLIDVVNMTLKKDIVMLV